MDSMVSVGLAGADLAGGGAAKHQQGDGLCCTTLILSAGEAARTTKSRVTRQRDTKYLGKDKSEPWPTATVPTGREIA